MDAGNTTQTRGMQPRQALVERERGAARPARTGRAVAAARREVRARPLLGRRGPRSRVVPVERDAAAAARVHPTDCDHERARAAVPHRHLRRRHPRLSRAVGAGRAPLLGGHASGPLRACQRGRVAAAMVGRLGGDVSTGALARPARPTAGGAGACRAAAARRRASADRRGTARQRCAAVGGRSALAALHGGAADRRGVARRHGSPAHGSPPSARCLEGDASRPAGFAASTARAAFQEQEEEEE